MKKRVTIYDIARQVGVSTASVNRALNGKGKVGEATRRQILDTAERMGYKANLAAKSLARKELKLGIVISDAIPEFSRDVIRGAETALEELQDYNVQGSVHTVERAECRTGLAGKLLELSESGYDGIVICPSDDSRTIRRTVEQLHEKGTAVATVVTDIGDSSRIFTVRHDGRQAGRMAAELLWWFVGGNGEIAIFTGNKEVKIHKETIEGFMLEQARKPLEIIGIYENQDDPDIAYYVTEKVLKEYPGIKGLYINSANSASVCRKISEMGLGGKIRIVASDVFPELKHFVEEGLVHATIFQDPFTQGRLAVKQLYGYLAEGKAVEEEILIKPQIVLASNMEMFIK